MNYFLFFSLFLFSFQSFAAYSLAGALSVCSQNASASNTALHTYTCATGSSSVVLYSHYAMMNMISDYGIAHQWQYLTSCDSPYVYNVLSSTTANCVLGQQCPGGAYILPTESCTRICPDGTSVSLYQDCPLHLCPNGSFVLDPSTCPKQLPDCLIPQNPITDECIYSKTSGNPNSCMDGGSSPLAAFYAYPAKGESCPTLWDGFFTKDGQTSLCGNGTTATAPFSCFDTAIYRTVQDLLSNPLAVGAIALTLGGASKPLFSLFSNPLTGLQSVKMSLPFAVKTSNSFDAASSIKFSSAEMQLPRSTLGQAMQDYMVANPNSQLAQKLQTNWPLGAGKQYIEVNPNTGVVTVVETGMPLSTTQLSATALSSNSLTPEILTELTPYIRLNTIPWLNQSLDYIEGDFVRVFDGDPNTQPINFTPSSNYLPLAQTQELALANPKPIVITQPDPAPYPYVSPLPNPNPQPEPEPNPNPDNYPIPNPDPNLSQNPNPTGNEEPIQNTPIPSGPIIPNNPGVPETPPEPPKIYPDTWKYFDFLPFHNPLNISVSPFIPLLPSPSCTYEIHQTVHIPFMGSKPFDIAPCEPLAPLRDVLAWVFSILTLFICFNVIFRSSF